MKMSKVISNVDLLNALRSTKSSTFKDRLPEITQDNIHLALEQMDKYEPMWNEMTGEIIKKIGMQIASEFDEFENPLAIFKKGDMPFGKTIEEIWMDLYPAQQFDQKASETEVLKREKPDIKTMYHYENRENFYKSTISLKDMRHAFYSENGLYDLIYSNFSKRLFQSDVLDEYLIMKELVDKAIEEADKEDAKVAKIELEYTDDKRFSQQLAKVMRSTAKQLAFYNTSTISGVKNVTSPTSQVIITTPEVEAMLDVDVLSHAFHMDKADTGRLSIIDQFADPDVLAVIASKDLLQQYDTYYNLEPELYNQQGLYKSYFLHHHGVYSFSKFENLVVIKKKDTNGEPETVSEKKEDNK